MKKLILASSSPRRAEVLRNAGIEFEVRPTDIDETRRPGEPAGDYVQRLALEKARAAVNSEGKAKNFIVVGADTVVVNRGEILLKPDSPEDARRMLRQLSGGVHKVHTGLAVICMPQKIERVIEEVTSVHFAELSDALAECPLKVRVAANSPSLWPTMFSVTYTGTNFFPLCTAIV